MSEVIKRHNLPNLLRALSKDFDDDDKDAAQTCNLAADEIDMLRRLDIEAANYVESPIVMRTHFTGSEPYVGWKGLGLALNECLDELDSLRKKNNVA